MSPTKDDKSSADPGKPTTIKSLDLLMQSRLAAMQVGFDAQLAQIVKSIESLHSSSRPTDSDTAEQSDIKSELACCQKENAALRAEVSAMRSILHNLGLSLPMGPSPVATDSSVENPSLSLADYPPLGSEPRQSPSGGRAVQHAWAAVLQQPNNHSKPDTVAPNHKLKTDRPSHQKFIKGTKTSACDLKTCARQPYPVKVFITKLDPGMKAEQLQAHIDLNFELETKVEQIGTKHPSYASFLIHASSSNYQTLLAADKWPSGILMKRWYDNPDHPPRKYAITSEDSSIVGGAGSPAPAAADSETAGPDVGESSHNAT